MRQASRHQGDLQTTCGSDLCNIPSHEIMKIMEFCSQSQWDVWAQKNYCNATTSVTKMTASGSWKKGGNTFWIFGTTPRSCPKQYLEHYIYQCVMFDLWPNLGHFAAWWMILDKCWWSVRKHMLNLVGKNSLQVNWRILWHVTTSSHGIPDHNHAALSLNKKISQHDHCEKVKLLHRISDIHDPVH